MPAPTFIDFTKLAYVATGRLTSHAPGGASTVYAPVSTRSSAANDADTRAMCSAVGAG